MDRVRLHEADVSAPQSQEDQQTWVPGAHEDAWRPEDAAAAACEGTQSSGREGRVQVAPAMSEPAGKERLPRAARIRRSGEIRTLIERGKRKRTASLDVFFSASPVARSRWGVVVPKHRRGIVRRNLLKRRLREIGRRKVLPALDQAGLAVDVLVRARWRAYDVRFPELSEELGSVTEGLCSVASWRD